MAYSLDEQITNKKASDGSFVYERTFRFAPALSDGIHKWSGKAELSKVNYIVSSAFSIVSEAITEEYYTGYSAVPRGASKKYYTDLWSVSRDMAERYILFNIHDPIILSTILFYDADIYFTIRYTKQG